MKASDEGRKYVRPLPAEDVRYVKVRLCRAGRVAEVEEKVSERGVDGKKDGIDRIGLG